MFHLGIMALCVPHQPRPPFPNSRSFASLGGVDFPVYMGPLGGCEIGKRWEIKKLKNFVHCLLKYSKSISSISYDPKLVWYGGMALWRYYVSLREIEAREDIDIPPLIHTPETTRKKRGNVPLTTHPKCSFEYRFAFLTNRIIIILQEVFVESELAPVKQRGYDDRKKVQRWTHSPFNDQFWTCPVHYWKHFCLGCSSPVILRRILKP